MTAYLNYATTAWPRRPEATAAFLEAARNQPQDLRHSTVSDRDIARARIATTLGVQAEHVFFAPDATTAINYVVNGLDQTVSEARIATDNRSHNAVLRPAHQVGGGKLVTIDLYADDDSIQLGALADLPGTPDLLVLTHTSNVTGSVYDVAQAIEEARGRLPGVRILVDASQSAGATNLRPALAADFVVFPGHKHVAALPGAAVLIARSPLCDWLTGGTGTSTLDIGMPPRRRQNFVEVGSGNAMAELAFATALENSVQGFSLIRHQTELLWNGLSEVPGVRLLGRPPGEDRTAIVAFVPMHGAPSTEWMAGLRHRGVVARGGLQCSPLHHKQLGLPQGTVRFSPGWATTDEEIEHAVTATRELAQALAVLDG